MEPWIELKEIENLISINIKEANKQIDNFYEKYTHNEIELTEMEEHFMFCLIEKISNKLYN